VGTCDTPPSDASRATETDRLLSFDLRGAPPFPFCPPVEPSDALRGCVDLAATTPASPATPEKANATAGSAPSTSFRGSFDVAHAVVRRRSRGRSTSIAASDRSKAGLIDVALPAIARH
jgi:hypothetical protein